MKHKRLLLIVGCLATVLVAGYVTLRLSAPGHRITEKSFSAIQKGMTEEEVEAVLGAKAGVVTGRTGIYARMWGASGIEMIKNHGGKEWVGENVSVYVRFDEAGRAKDVLLGDVPGEESFLGKLRRWLGM